MGITYSIKSKSNHVCMDMDKSFWWWNNDGESTIKNVLDCLNPDEVYDLYIKNMIEIFVESFPDAVMESENVEDDLSIRLDHLDSLYYEDDINEAFRAKDPIYFVIASRYISDLEI